MKCDFNGLVLPFLSDSFLFSPNVAQPAAIQRDRDAAERGRSGSLSLCVDLVYVSHYAVFVSLFASSLLVIIIIFFAASESI